MSLKELKRLAPWQWESKVATKKHKIGPKGLQEWEQVRLLRKILQKAENAQVSPQHALEHICCCANNTISSIRNSAQQVHCFNGC